MATASSTAYSTEIATQYFHFDLQYFVVSLKSLVAAYVFFLIFTSLKFFPSKTGVETNSYVRCDLSTLYFHLYIID